MQSVSSAAGSVIDGLVVSERPKAVARRPKAEMGPLKELAGKHRLLIDYVVNGVPEAKKHLLDYHYRSTPTEDDPDCRRELKPNEPLRLEEAARVLGIRLRHARHLFNQPVFVKAYQAELDSLRNGSKVDALRKVIEIVGDDGDGSAAFRKVQLSAAGMILGSDEQNSKPQVNVNVGVNLTAGVVVRLPADAPSSPLEINGEAVEND
jgi:hypothetical protein